MLRTPVRKRRFHLWSAPSDMMVRRSRMPMLPCLRLQQACNLMQTRCMEMFDRFHHMMRFRITWMPAMFRVPLGTVRPHVWPLRVITSFSAPLRTWTGFTLRTPLLPTRLRTFFRTTLWFEVRGAARCRALSLPLPCRFSSAHLRLRCAFTRFCSLHVLPSFGRTSPFWGSIRPAPLWTSRFLG
jgi:hypothetical protein